ncbi:unnamed protein product [Trichobilharzia regenti]|nr:unnamed protein product [Trichobilharzia regenti]
MEALLPYSSNNNNANLINGTPLASINNESGQKLNDVNNSNVNYSLEKIDDHLDVIQKLTCWPHVTGKCVLSSKRSCICLSTKPSVLIFTIIISRHFPEIHN